MSTDDTAADAFGAYLRAQRKLARLTLRELSELTNVSNPYLSQIERGVHQPSVKVIRSLAEALNLSAETLLAQAAGIDPDGAEPAEDETERAIRNDPRLDDEQKTALLTILRNFLREAESAG